MLKENTVVHVDEIEVTKPDEKSFETLSIVSDRLSLLNTGIRYFGESIHYPNVEEELLVNGKNRFGLLSSSLIEEKR